MSGALDDRWLSAVADRLRDRNLLDEGAQSAEETLAALDAFRVEHGIEPGAAPEGSLDQATLDLLFWQDAGEADGPSGRSGARELSALLHAAGYIVGPGSANTAALQRFREDAGLTGEGPLSDEEVAVLASLASKRTPVSPSAVPLYANLSGARPSLPREAELSMGRRGDLVAFAQHLLASRGSSIAIDGDFGPATRAAVEAFEADSGRPVDGVMDGADWARLAHRCEPLIAPATGRMVRRLQRRLAELGFEPGPIDGVVGEKTTAALCRAQRLAQVEPSGGLDLRTAVALFSGAGGLPRTLRELRRRELGAVVAGKLHHVPADARVRVHAVLAAAIGNIGLKEVPPGSNGGPGVDEIIEDYLSPVYQARHGKPPWCVLAVCAWMKRGLACSTWSELPFGRRFGAVSQVQKWGAARGRLGPAKAFAEPGCVFVMRRDGSGSDPSARITAGHAGLVLADRGDAVLTIEGNVRHAVRSKLRPKSQLVGLVRWW